jgi:hypothetical protein
MSNFSSPEIKLRNERICEMRRAGKAPTEIAAEMGLSRKAVIGVLFRAGLTDSRHCNAAGRGQDYSPEFRRLVLAEVARSNAHRAAVMWGVKYSVVWGWTRKAAA